MGTLFERLYHSRLAESALITVHEVTASRKVATKPTTFTIATAALDGGQQEEALVVECVVAEGSGMQGWRLVSIRTRDNMNQQHQ